MIPSLFKIRILALRRIYDTKCIQGLKELIKVTVFFNSLTLYDLWVTAKSKM